MKLYSDFAVLKNGKYGTPKNFNRITPSWYLNEPNKNCESNVYLNKDFYIFAKRDIKKGEELTFKYSSFSEHIKRY